MASITWPAATGFSIINIICQPVKLQEYVIHENPSGNSDESLDEIIQNKEKYFPKSSYLKLKMVIRGTLNNQICQKETAQGISHWAK